MKKRLMARFDSFSLSQTVWLHTHRTTVIDELTDTEIEGIYALFFPTQSPIEYSEREIALRNARSTILTIATRTGIKKPNSWVEFNRWMRQSSVLKKDLNRYSLEELGLLHKQFRALERNFSKSAVKMGNKAWYQKNDLPIPSKN